MSRFLVACVVTLAILSGISLGAWRVIQQRRVTNQVVESLKKEDISITIIEGKRREEIAAQVASLGITSYTDFMAASEGKEGHLFPDTYRFFANTPASDVVAALTKNYTSR